MCKALGAKDTLRAGQVLIANALRTGGTATAVIGSLGDNWTQIRHEEICMVERRTDVGKRGLSYVAVTRTGPSEVRLTF